MAGIFKRQKNQGFVLLAAMLVTTLMLLLAIYITSFILTEMKISNSQAAATQTYYLAESGIAEAIWKLKNDATWKNNFETNPTWSFTYTRDPALYESGSYTIQIQNTGKAQGQIIATGFLQVGQSVAKRVIKTTIYKAMGDSPLGENAQYSDGNFDISGSVMNVYNGGIHSNNIMNVNLWSVLNADGNVEASNHINLHWTSTINAAAMIDGAPNLPMPAVSFENLSDPESYKSRATVIYTESQFSDLMWNNQNLTLPGPITYVTGDISIYGAENLTINGALVAEGNIKVGTNTLLCCRSWRCGRSTVDINPISSSTPSGLLAKGYINFELCFNSFDADGLVYANDKINILSLPAAYNLRGGMISRKLTLTSIWQGLNITRVNDYIISSLGDPVFSPVVTVEHWEEEY